MATIQAAIQLFDGVTNPLRGMAKVMDTVITSFEAMQSASGRAVDVESIRSAREELARVDVAMDNIERNVDVARRAQERLNDTVDKGGGAADNLLSKFKSIAATVAGTMGAKKIMEMSDQIANTRARLNFIVDDGGSVADLEAKIRASAQRSRAAYQTTADMVAKLGMQAGDAFGNNNELIAFAESLNKSFAIAGADAQAIDSVMYNLTQALASGVLRGQDLNAVFSNAPNIIQNIADYLDVPIGKVRDMAAEGTLTADVVKNAMFAAVDDINAQFATMPTTWGQVWTMFTDWAINALQPLFQVVAAGAQWISDNWSALEPVFIGLTAAVAAYALIMGVLAAAKWLAVAANQALIISLLSNPVLWIALAIGVLIAQIYKWVQAVGGIRIAWMICVNNMLSAWDSLKIGFFTGVYWVLNLWDQMAFGISAAGVAISNYMSTMSANVLMLLQNLVNGAIGIINSFIAALNTLPGVSIEAVSQVTFGASAQLAASAANQARNAALEDARNQLNANEKQRAADIRRMEIDAAGAAVVRDAKIRAAQTAAERAAESAAGNAAAVQADAYAGPVQQIGNNTGNTAGNTAAMANSLDYMEEDLAYMRDIAEREVVNRFTTAEITINQDVTNTIASDVDVDGVINRLAADFAEQVNISAEGVHA